MNKDYEWFNLWAEGVASEADIQHMIEIRNQDIAMQMVNKDVVELGKIRASELSYILPQRADASFSQYIADTLDQMVKEEAQKLKAKDKEMEKEMEKEMIDKETPREVLERNLSDINKKIEEEINEQKSIAKDLASAHFDYIGELLSLAASSRGVEYSDEEMDLFSFIYETAFVHGYKHAVEDL